MADDDDGARPLAVRAVIAHPFWMGTTVCFDGLGLLMTRLKESWDMIKITETCENKSRELFQFYLNTLF